MAKPTYKVWVVNLVPLGTTVRHPEGDYYYYDWDQTKLDDTVKVLKELFDAVCAHATSKFGSTDVVVESLETVASKIGPGELLMRLTTKKQSILVKKFGSDKFGEAEGATFDTGSGVVSECWIEYLAGNLRIAKLLGRLAFHELMHNKIDATDDTKDIHAKPPGGTDGTGLAVKPIAHDTELSSENKANMAPRLGSVVKQFTGASIP